MLQSLNQRARKFESKMVRPNRSDPESNDTESESPPWTTRPSGYALAMTNSRDESAGARSESATPKAEFSEETGTEWSEMDDT